MSELFSNHALNQLFEVEEYRETGKLITTPFSYPDGDLIQISCFAEGRTLCFSDNGETVRWLQNHGIEDTKACILKTLKYQNIKYRAGEIVFEADLENEQGGILTDSGQVSALFQLINTILEISNYCLGESAHLNREV